MGRARTRRPRSDITVPGGRYGRAAVQGLLTEIDEASDKRRALVRAARRTGQLLGGAELEDRDALEVLLVDAGVDQGLKLGDVRRLVQREIDVGTRSPKRAPAAPGAFLRDRQDARDFTLQWMREVDMDAWNRRSAAMVLKLLGGFATISLAAGKVRFEASYRQLAEEAHMSVQSVHRYLPETRRYVRQVRQGSRTTGHCSEWQLICHPDRDKYKQPAYAGTMASGLFANVPPAGRDENVWHGRPNARRLYRLLEADEVNTVRGLAVSTGLHDKTVRRNLRWLVAHGLADGDDDGTWRRTIPDELHVSMIDFDAARRERHRLDRELFDSYNSTRARGSAEALSRGETTCAVEPDGSRRGRPL